MKLIVKKLQGAECVVEVNENTCISQVKDQVYAILKIPIDEQKLLLNGKTLADDKTIDFYTQIKEGTKINLIIVKPESLEDKVLKIFKSSYKNDEAEKRTKLFMTIFHKKIAALSLDDLERIASNYLYNEEPI